MKKLLHATYILAVAWCISLIGISSAHASHIQGGQLTYEALGNNRYKVSLTVFRDCGGAAFSTISAKLNFSSTGCASGPELPMTLTGNPEAGSPYCANTPGGASQCSASSLTNYQKGTFEATITLPPAAEWIISVTLNARPGVANINPGTGNLYYEARLNNLLPNGTQINNTSPQYQAQDIPIPFVCKSQERTISFATTEPDGDSLVYALATPLQGCNEPNTYKSYTGGIPFIDLTLPGGDPCGAYIKDNQGTYSPTYPLASYNMTGACPLKTAVKAFNFNPNLGTFTFTPANFNTAINSAENKYVVVGQVTEYRRFTGANGKPVYYKVGQVRRDMLVVVIDCNNNNLPGPPIGSGFDKSGVKIVNSRDSTFVTAYTCNYTEVRFRFSDPNPGDILTVSHPELDPSIPTLAKPTYLPSDVATFQLLGNGTASPAGILRIQPDIAFLGKTYRIPVKIEDNACPFKGIQYRTIVLKIEKGNFAKVVASTSDPVVCAGTPVSLTASPFRPDSVAGNPARYGYKWDAAPGLPTAQLTNQKITVTPTVTTRYHVRILGLDFREGTCSDTASVLVRVQQAVKATAATSVPLVCSGGSASLTATAARPGNAQETFTYQWTAANGLSTADATKATLTVKPTATTRYKLRVASTTANAVCGTDTASVLVRVAQPIVTAFKVDSAAVGGRSIKQPPLLFTFTNQSKVAAQPNTVPRYQWSYQRIANSKGQAINDTEQEFSKSSTVATQQFMIAGIYKIRLRSSLVIGAASSSPCQETLAEVNIRVPDSQVPNIFTPNGDGINDAFVISTEAINSKIQIFNRWGRQVFSTDSYRNDWTGDAQPAGVYYYMLTDVKGTTSKGWVELVR
ncbi:gliding motility-associated C-terminal domain-containing protein [Hymenobacter cellulosivorans]|uniref:Gliding motility-associated C-terminal domain-containing protein n=1 Tax=Hymenobacter cellulosivorans TaxID=2932249 RepID=A0ABY4FAB4_9BACT|nr:gliding motility-associated C-terminal domain-containing protein [Hymenobacter cellulosivorans]UOQ53443.1 gliding motility-associated C-terminal domain-containing protein [Hymenobacter cellulosivorans]